MALIRTLGLFVLAGFLEIAGCYFTYLWLKKMGPPWLPLLSLGCLGIFAFLLTLQTGAAGRTYAAYGGIYVAISLVWLWLVEHQRPTLWDMIGAGVMFVGMSIILVGGR